MVKKYNNNMKIKKGFLILTSIFLVIILSNVSSASNLNLIENKNDNINIHDVTIIIADIYVDDDADPGWYDAKHVQTIQEGIDNATSGDFVYVYNGTYVFRAIVNKSIDIQGECKFSTIKSYHGFLIEADNVNISGFTIQDVTHESWLMQAFTIIGNKVTIFNNIIENNMFSFWIDKATQVTIKNNNFTHNVYDILMRGSYANLISDNNFMMSNYGIILSYSNNNIICYNTMISDNKGGIIQLNECKDCTISYNTLKNCYNGIEINGDFEKIKSWVGLNNIHHNHIENITETGLFLGKTKINNIHHNNFINCEVNAFAFFSRFNIFRRNYWGRAKILPKRIRGIGSGLVLMKYDLFPALKPYEI